MSRTIALLFSIICYAIFFATFLYLIAFVGNLPVPKTVDAPLTAVPREAKIIIDVALIALFGLQHSVMARPGFKAAWTRIVPEPIERSLYVVFASLALILLYHLWQPLPGLVWSIDNPAAADLIWALFGLGWLIALLSTFLISHFELFGLQQVWNNLRGRAAAAPV